MPATFNSGTASVKAQHLGPAIAALDAQSRPDCHVPKLHHRPSMAMRESVAFYAGAWQSVQGGGDHAFPRFENQIAPILTFASSAG